MKKIFLLIAICALQYSCNNEENENKVSEEVITSEKAVVDIDSVIDKKNIRISIDSFSDYNNYEQFARETCALLEKAINSEEFKIGVLNGKFKSTNGLTNQEIYEVIMKANEKQGPGGQDFVWNLRLRTLTLKKDGKKWMQNCELDSRAGTIGIDGNGDGVTAICPQTLEYWAKDTNYAELAGHYAHEYMHILGFSHPGATLRIKNKSAVYKIGDLITEIINKNN